MADLMMKTRNVDGELGMRKENRERRRERGIESERKGEWWWMDKRKSCNATLAAQNGQLPVNQLRGLI